MSQLMGVYQPGTTLLHRVPAGAKLLTMAVLSLVVVTWRSPVATAALLVAVLGLLLWARVRVRLLLRTLRGLLVLVVLLSAWQAWQRGWEHAFTVVGSLVGLILLATVLTVTTSVDEMLDTLVRALGPARRLGVDPERVALAFSLMVRGIPTTLDLAVETRQAAMARGLERHPRALLVPMVLRSVAHARATGEALHARGIADD